MINVKKLILPVAVLTGTVFLYSFIMSNPPEAQRRGPSKASQMSVQVEKIESKDYPIVLESYGTVQPRTQSGLVSQVGGQITYVSDQFREGGFISKGDVLVIVDEVPSVKNGTPSKIISTNSSSIVFLISLISCRSVS